MHAHQQPDMMTIPAKIRARARPQQLRLPAPPQRQTHASSTVPRAVVACLLEARRPTQQEIEAVAARMWSEVRGRRGPNWSVLVSGSRDHRRMIALARAALGVPRSETGIGASARPIPGAGIFPLLDHPA